MKDKQFSADKIQIIIGKEGIKEIHLLHNGFIIGHTQENEYDQVKGKNIILFIANEEIERAVVIGNAESIYFIRDDDSVGATIGVNIGICSELEIIFNNQKISHLNAYKKPIMATYPIDKLPEEKRYLRDFKWLDTQKPKQKKDIYPSEKWNKKEP